MANNFTSDTNCKALWQFENGADFANDSQGGNDLTASANPPTADTTNKKEGTSSALFNDANSQYFYRANADLDTGFPLKSGDTSKKISVCFWWKAAVASFANYDEFFTFWDTNQLSLLLRHTNRIEVVWGLETNYQSITLSPDLVISSGVWYHTGFVIDGVNKTVLVRIWNDTTQVVTNLTGTASQVLYVGSANLRIGANQGPSELYNGQIDEMVVFSDLLIDDEIDDIRNQTYIPNKVYSKSSTILSAVSWVTLNNSARTSSMFLIH